MKVIFVFYCEYIWGVEVIGGVMWLGGGNGVWGGVIISLVGCFFGNIGGGGGGGWFKNINRW